jgi:OmpA-OmpF porin, OOP family
MHMSAFRAVALVSLVALVGACAAEAKVAPKPPPPPAPAPAPPPAPPPPPKETKKFTATGLRFKVNDKGEVELPDPVLFETGTANLKPESDKPLGMVLTYLQQKPEVTKLRIEGHTDTDGDDAGNMTLSRDRSTAVSQWLVAKGIDCRRLVPIGFGESHLVVTPEQTQADKAKNRRVVFANAEVNDKPVGGTIDGGQPAGDPCK